jgi:TP901 family phage tail tape measure protein
MARFWGALILCTGGVVVSEVLRELVVSLSLNSDNFARNMRTINQQIKEAESGFLLAGAGVEKYEKTINGVKSKLSTLGEVHTHQTRAVEQYSRALVAAHQKIDASYQRQEQMTSRLGAARTQYAQLGTQLASYGMTATDVATRLSDVNDKIAKYSTMANKPLGALQQLDTERTRLLQIQAAQERYKALGEEITKLEGQLKANSKTLQNNADEISKVQTNLNKAKAAVKETESEIKKLSGQLVTMESRWTKAGTALDAFSKKANAVSKAIAPAGRNLTKYVTTPILGLGAAAIKSSIDFESAFTSVRKTVDATEEEFSELSGSIKTMSTQVASSASDIAEVVAVAGQLGISNDHLMEFARTMIDLGNSTDIVAEDAASTLAKFANITGMNQGEFERLGSTLVDLGNNYATTESSIMEMSLRLAAAGHQVGLSEAQILGFAAALSSVGIEAQMGGSAFSKALVKMEVASATGGQALEDFAKVSGMTAQQFKTLWDSDPAAAFQAFIVGLSKMDDEGESAIATLQEIGISEVRLRDTLLRATNATELFSNTQKTATKAWEENTALSVEAGKRYATTESRLKNLKNTALLFAQQIGDDLNPTIQMLIDKANDLLASFMGLDESQRMAIIKFAAVAAAVGPAILIIGKMVSGIGKASKAFSVVCKGIGTFSGAVKLAGGGMGGLVKTLASSKLAMVALAAAVVYAAYKWADYASGAKEAREALEGMNKTAKQWKDTAAETFYGSSQGLSFFGMSEDNFTRETQSAEDWLNGLLGVWSDGKKETDEIVEEWTGSFKTLTASTRDALTEMKTTADEAGYTGMSEQLQTDIDSLNAMDAEIEALLKKRKSKNFTDKDKVRLQELIDAREAIEVKYHLTPADTDGFETIAQKVQAEVARAQARGQSDADVSVYENAMLAAAQGMAAVDDQLDAEYDKQYALIQLMDDGAEKTQAQAELDAKYTADRKAAAQEYAETLASIVMPVWNQPEMQEAGTQVDTLLTLLREYSMASEADKPAILTDLQELTAEMDEGSLTEYLSLMTQIQSLMDSGLTEAEISTLFPDIDVSAQLDQFAGIADYIGLIKEDLPGLYGMFGESLPEEVLKIATDLDMTGAQARWDEFAENPGAITTDAIISGYTEAENAAAQQPKVEAFITKYTEVAEGADTASLTPTGLLAYVTTYAEATSGTDVSSLTPENITAMVSAYQELAAGADVSTLTPSEITAYITKYLENEGVDVSALSPDAITAFVMAYEEATGGALTTALTPDNITAMVVKYLEAEGVDLSALTPEQIEAIVDSYAEATNCDKSLLLPSLTAYITEYREAEGVTVPKPQTRVVITGYDYLAYQDLQGADGLELEIPVRLGELPDGELDQLLSDGKVKFWKDGVEVPIEAVPDGTVTADTIAALEQDGTLHILITPEVTGTQEAIDSISPMVDEADQLGVTWAGMWAGIMPITTMDKIDSAIERLNSYQKTLDYNAWDKFWATVFGESTDKGVLDTSMKLDFDAETVAQLSAYVSEMVAAILRGEEVSEEDLTNLQNIVTFLNGLDTTDTGAHVLEGIAQGMTEAGWDSDAETVAANLEAALNQALQINSPSKLVKPVGSGTAEGIALGMKEYGFATDASTVAQNLQTALAAVLTATTLRSVGLNAMNGLKAGIQAGTLGVVTAMRSAARAAVNAAKAELKIASPSGVFRDEVGRMAMKGLGQGALLESKAQAKVIRNAARYLTDTAQTGIVTGSAYSDNRKTYNQNATSTVHVDRLYVNDKQDVTALAVEIASLTRRRQRGRGRKNA